MPRLASFGTWLLISASVMAQDPLRPAPSGPSEWDAIEVAPRPVLKAIGMTEVVLTERQSASESDSLALLALFQDGGGASWPTTNWATGPVATWEGVTVEDGRVTRLILTPEETPGIVLKGALPSDLGNLTELEVLVLSDNEITQLPEEIGSLTNLRAIDVTRNELEGELPISFRHLTQLEYMAVGGNRIAGTIPDWLRNLSGLRFLYWWGDLEGPVPGWLAEDLPLLEDLDLSLNRFTSTIPDELGDLEFLKRLIITNAGLSGPIPPQLGRLNSIELISLWGNNLEGEIPEGLAGATTLQSLVLNKNALSGSIPAALSELESLRNLSLWGNELSGEIPPTLGNLGNLERLYLSDNNLSGPIPPALGGLQLLNTLWLSDNELSGPIPIEMASLKRVGRFYLSGNQLSGPIPDEIGEMSGLVDFQAASNQLTGSIPPDLGGLAQLERLVLKDNQLTGPIPATIGRLSKLHTLLLQRNDLEGSLPPTLADLSNLRRLDLSDNDLRGILSLRLASFAVGVANQETCNLRGNSVDLCVPDSQAYWTLDSEAICGLPLRQDCLSIVDATEGELPDGTNLFIEPLYPNPTSEFARIRFGLSAPAYVELRVVNAIGQVEVTNFQSSVSAGVHDIDLDVTALPGGAYIVQLISEGVSISRGLHVIR